MCGGVDSYPDFIPHGKNLGIIVSFPWRIPCHFMKWVGTERRGCSEESVFQESQILCYIWVWSVDKAMVVEALLRTKLHSWAIRCNLFRSNLLVLLVLVDSA